MSIGILQFHFVTFLVPVIPLHTFKNFMQFLFVSDRCRFATRNLSFTFGKVSWEEDLEEMRSGRGRGRGQ